MLTSLSNIFYLSTPAIGIIVSFLLIVFVLYRNHKRTVNRLFALVLLSLGLWSFFIFAMRASPDLQHALYWEKMVVPTGTALPVFYYHFTSVYTHMENKKLLLTAYLLLIATIILSESNLVIRYMSVGHFGYAPRFYPAMYVIALGAVTFLVCGLINLIKARRYTNRHEERMRYNYMILAIVFPFIGGFLDLFPNHPPFGIPGNILFCVVTATAIVKVHLLDIWVALRKVLPYVLVSAVIASLYIGSLVLLHRILGEGGVPEWTNVIIIILIAVVFNPLWQKAQEFVNRMFYRQRYNFLVELERFNCEIHDIRDLEAVGSMLVKLIRQALQTSGIHLLLLESDQFTSIAHTRDNNLTLKLKNRSPLTRWLQSSSRLLYRRDINVIPQLRTMSTNEIKTLEDNKVELLVPLRSRADELVGILVLGEKRSGQPYSNEDEQLILAVAGRFTVEVENARLYEESLQAERALRESERLFRTIVEAAPSFLMIVDETGMIQYVSPNCEHFTGYAPEELTEKVTFWVLENDQEKLRREIAHAFREGSEGNAFEFKAVKKTGELWYASSSWKPLRDENDEIKAVVIQTIDITERKQEEKRRKEIAEKAQLTSHLASIGEMASGIAHEINNPLTGVVGYSELLMRSRLPQNVRGKLNIIHDGAQRVAGIVNRLLAFAGQRKPTRAYVNINEIIRTTLELRAYEMKTNNIQTDTQLDPELPYTMADAGQLQQVFLNIILNAESEMKLTQGRGKLLISTVRKDDIIHISFKDDGPGISDENINQIFSPFFTTRQVGQGTGLGLSICHGIVTEHHGRIYVESELGKGADFIVELPVESNKRQD